MLDYLNFDVDLDAPDAVWAYDELLLWSAMSGLLLLENVDLNAVMPRIRKGDPEVAYGFS